MVELLTITILTLSFHDIVQSGKTIELKTLIYIVMLHSITSIVEIIIHHYRQMWIISSRKEC
jgi:hypothetical protein